MKLHARAQAHNFEADPGLATLTGKHDQWPAETVLRRLKIHGF